MRRRLEAAQRPRRFARIATTNRFDAIAAMVLRTTPRGLRYRLKVAEYLLVSVPVTFYFDRQQLSRASGR